MKKACVIGWPIAHSRSPLIHGFWLKRYKIEGTYERIAIPPDRLHEFLINLHTNGFVGCNVTIPHKENALTAINHLDDSVKSIGALNTVYMKDGQTYATSTDGDGFLQNLIAHHPDFSTENKRVVILGAGGSAKAIVERLLRANVENITIINRTIARAQELKDAFGSKLHVRSIDESDQAMKTCDLLINTTSQGMNGQDPLNIDLSNLPHHAIVADIVYVPLKTAFINSAEARGLRIVPGLGMLLYQAVRGFELWFGIKPEVTSELYALIARDIDPDFKL
jgi:shikimate dehydrogenase